MSYKMSPQDLAMAEVYSIKIIVICLIRAHIEAESATKETAAKHLLATAQGSAAAFSLSGSPPETEAAVREAMSERIESMILSAMNPYRRAKR